MTPRASPPRTKAKSVWGRVCKATCWRSLAFWLPSTLWVGGRPQAGLSPMMGKASVPSFPRGISRPGSNERTSRREFPKQCLLPAELGQRALYLLHLCVCQRVLPWERRRYLSSGVFMVVIIVLLLLFLTKQAAKDPGEREVCSTIPLFCCSPSTWVHSHPSSSPPHF